MTQKEAPFRSGQMVKRATEDELFDRGVDIRSFLNITSMFGDQNHRITRVIEQDGNWYVTLSGDYSMHLQDLPANTYRTSWFNLA
jgi:hypothetical protein